MPEFTFLNYSCSERIATITLQRADTRNSLNQKLRIELLQALTLAAEDDSVRVIILSAEGKSFCAGADLNERLDGFGTPGFTEQQLCEEYNPIITRITRAPKPVIAAVSGAAAGFGAALVMACDLVVMSPDAYLYSAFGAISLVPDGGAHKFLLQSLGSKKAYEMIAFSQKQTAEQCLQAGIANRIICNENLLQETQNWAVTLTQQAPLTLRYSKQLLNDVANQSLDFCLQEEARIQDPLVRSRDFEEGASAFAEKRPPVFIGK